LLVWDKDSYTERLLALLPCYFCIETHIGSSLPDLFTSSYSPSPSGLCSLRLLYSLLYSGHISHIQVLGFLPSPYFSRARSPLSVWPTSNNISTFSQTFLINIRGVKTQGSTS
jgi:hypothetical protein